jgi:hypothetical protein
MTDHSRVSMPEEFFDITSAMLLRQPEPQYLYAQLMKSALAADLAPPSMIGMPGRAVGGVGADYKSADADRLRLSDPISTEVFAARVDMRGKPGHTIKINRPKFTDSTYTEASRRINVGQTISTTTMAPDSEQAMITLHRYGGPFYTTTEVRPYGIDAFDAEMGVHRASAVIGMHLQRDFDKCLDTWARDLLNDAASAVYPQGMSAVNDPTGRGQYPLDYETISRLERVMDEANLPVFGDGKRLLVITPTGKKQLKDDPQFARYSEVHRDLNPLFPGTYLTTCGNFHVFQSNTLSQTDNSSSVEIQYGHAICPGALGVCMGRPPQTRYSTDDNYGESQKIIWLADLGFKLLDSRFVYSVRYTEEAQD